MSEKKHIFKSANVCDGTCVECRTLENVLPLGFLAGILLFLLYFVTFSSPVGFPTSSYVKIKEGTSVLQIGEELAARNVVRSPILFAGIVRLLGGERSTVAGEYFFSRPLNTFGVAMKLITGDFEITPVRVVFPEGITVRDMKEILEKRVPDFDSNAFYNLAIHKEGYLFPDTYFINPGEEPEVVIDAMEENFKRHTAVLKPILASSTITLEEAVVMASILEKEAWKDEDQKRIAGVLWRRINIGMPLQTDATFPYYLGRNTFEVTLEDLKADHPYNTYTNKGLPPGPIGNPGLAAITAALQPVKTNYLYFLSDRSGTFHFSTTYAQHLRFKAQYLD